MGKELLITLALLSLAKLISATNVVCYHGTWSHYRQGNGKFSTSDTPANLCTHYIYAFVGLDSTTNTVKLLDSWLDIDLGGLASAVALKNTNPNIKILLAIGGWNEGSAKYSAMAASASTRATFVQSVVSLVRQYGFDGFDVDWEYPARRDSSNAADKDNYSLLLKELHDAFSPYNLCLTAAVSATPSSVAISYDVPSLVKYLTFINVMTYDFHGSFDNFTGHNSPLRSSARLYGTEYAEYSVEASILGWIAAGAPPSKLAVGLPFYGRTTTLSNAANTALGAPTTSTGGPAGPYTQTSGFLGYNEIIEQFNAGGWTQAWDDEQQVPYAYKGNTWLSYDNPKSLTLKVEWAKSLGLGGIMIWSIETEDFHGLSGTQYPLLNAINTALATTSSDSSDTSDNSNSSDNGSSSDNSSSGSDNSSSDTDNSSSASETDNSANSDSIINEDISLDSDIVDGSSNSDDSSSSSTTRNVICYHGTWSHYRLGNGKFSTSDTPANLCTHYIYAFVGLDSTTNTVKLLDSWLDIDLGGLASAVALKQTNPNIKVLIAIGGWNEGSAKYSAMAASASSRATFVQSALSLVQQYGFDGFDVDWEYPARRDSANPADRENFSLLIKELYAAFNPLGKIITAAVSATPSSVAISYDVPVLSKYLTFINVMTYDFHGSFDNFTGHNSPLRSSARLYGTEYADYSIEASILGWIKAGADPQKIAVGVPFYGRTTTLSNAANTKPGAPTTSTGGPAGPYTQTSGFLGYNEIIEQFNAGGWTQAWDHEQQVPYAYKGNTWLSYDNPKSLTLKVNWAKSLGVGAIMMWSIETEDFHGLSGTKYPLLKAINTALGLPSSDSTSDTDSSSGTDNSSGSDSSSGSDNSSGSDSSSGLDPSSDIDPSSGSDNSSSSDNSSCTPGKYYRDATDCSKFYFCQVVNGETVSHSFSCSGGLLYDSNLGTCNYAAQVTC